MTIDKSKRKDLIEMFDLLSQAFAQIDSMSQDGDLNTTLALLSQCQESAIAIGTSIEETCGEGTQTVKLLEQLCEDIYNYSAEIQNGRNDANTSLIRNTLSSTRATLDNEFPEVKEIVFLPCSPDMWNGFAAIYDSMITSSNYDVKVIPIPWYDRLDGNLIDEDNVHFETTGYPSNVCLTDFQKYDFAGIHPDEIYIQNAYDNQNLGGTVHPLFYTSSLRKFTDKLIYVPYYVYQEPSNINNKGQLAKLQDFMLIPGLNNIDKIILQSENMKLAVLTILAGEEDSQYKNLLEEKIIGDGHPRIKSLQSASANAKDIPKEWKKYIEKSDGSSKKIILYCNSVTGILENNLKLITKIKNSFEIFKENKEDVALIWRPHPLINDVIEKLRPELSESFKNLIDEYRSSDLGILDGSNDPALSISIADAYYGDNGSVMELFKATGKPIMIENCDINM